MRINKRNQWQVFICTVIYLLINVVQAYFTELHYDEAYYWWYGQHLDWGFLDHPPMVAFLAQLFQYFGKNELIVRLGTLLVSTGFLLIYLFWVHRSGFNRYLSLLLLLSLPLAHTHIVGFMALPDVPLMFFVLAFLVTYQYFLERQTFGYSLLLGVIAAGMIYSKYHAVLVLFFLVLSNLSLLRSKYFWTVVFVTILLMIPHLWWQYEHHFPTLTYHLISRTKDFTFKYLGEHLLNILVISGPLTFLFFIRGFYMRRHETVYERGLMFVTFGFFLFFLITSFKLRTQVQWLIPAVPGILYFTLKGLHRASKRMQHRLYICCWLSITLLLCGRIYIGSNLIPSVGKSKDAFYNNKVSTDNLLRIAKEEDRKVAFYNSYSFASVHGFYSDEPAVMLHYPGYRMNQYHYESDQELLRGEDLMALLFIPGLPVEDYVDYGKYKKAVFEHIDDFYPIENLKVNVEDVITANDSVEFIATLKNEYEFVLDLENKSNIQFGIYHQKDLFSYHSDHLSRLIDKTELQPSEQVTVHYKLPKSLVQGKQIYVFVLNHGHSVGGFQWIDTESLNDD